MTDATPKLRWYRLTPGLFVVGLLAVEGLLWLSERFQWFGFNQHKGWTVLIAVACVGAFFAVMLVWWLAALVFPVRFQFSLRSILLLTVSVAAAFGWLGTSMRAATRQKEAVERIWELKGHVKYDWYFDAEGDSLPDPQPPQPLWLENLLGEDFFQRVVIVFLNHTNVMDDGLKSLGDLPHILSLSLDNTQVTDAGLKYLAGLTELRDLWLGNTSVTDEGVKKLQQALPNCTIIPDTRENFGGLWTPPTPDERQGRAKPDQPGG